MNISSHYLIAVVGAALVATPLAATAQANGQSAAADTVALSLDQALAGVMASSQEARLARSELTVAAQQVRAARSAALPTLNGSINYTRTFETPFSGGGSALPDSLRFEPDTTASLNDRVRYIERNAKNAGLEGFGALFGNLPFGRENTYVAMLTAAQPLYSAGKVGAALRIATEYRSAAELGLEEKFSELELRTRTAYVRAQLAQELERIASAAVEQADAFLAQERLRLETGVASELDVLRAEVAAENLRPDLVAARNAASVATLDLKSLLNLPATTTLALTTPLAVPTAAVLAADVTLDRAELAQRPAVQAAERGVAIKQQQIRIARAGGLPSINLRVNYGKQAFPSTVFGLSDATWLSDVNAVVGVSIPFFTGFRVSAETEQARIALDQEEMKLDQLRESVGLQYEQAVGERARAAASLAARTRTVAQASRVHDLTVLRYEQGLATQLEVSDARLALLRARTSLAQATADYHLAAAAVVRALGETTVSH